MKVLLLLACSIATFFCQAQQKRNVKFEEEKIALQFFLDSIYPYRPLIKDKKLVSNGRICQASYYYFVHTIPNYRKIKELYLKDEKSGIYRTPVKNRPKEYQGGIKGNFSPCKYCIRKRSDNWFTNKRDSTLATVELYSMYYDSTKQETLVNLQVSRTSLGTRRQKYMILDYVIIIDNKQVKHWAFRETF